MTVFRHGRRGERFLTACRFSALLFSLFIPLSALHAATPAEIDSARTRAVAWLLQNQHGSGYWRSTSAFSIPETSTVSTALRNAGVTGMPYSRAISWLRNADSESVDALSRQIIALQEAGSNTQALMNRLLALRNDRYLAWGPYPGYEPNFPDTPLALDTILATGTTYADTSGSLGYIIGKQNVDGGWSYSSGSNSGAPQSRLLPTVLNILTLIRYRDAQGWSVQANITNGITWLLGKQKAESVGISFGDDANGTVIETALAYEAIAAELGVSDSAAVGAQDYLLSQQDPNGSWNDAPFATGLVLGTLPATTMIDGDNDGVPDLVESQLGTDPAVPDSRYLASGNSQGQSGINLPINITSGDINSFLQAQLADTGGTGPFTWVIVSGALPSGMTLTPGTGLISGTPTTAGTFNFTYEVTDSLPQTMRFVTQIVISAGIVPDGDINEDGTVDTADVLLAYRIVLGQLTPTANQLAHGDVAPLVGGVPSPDGQFNSGDVLVIQRKALGLVNF